MLDMHLSAVTLIRVAVIYVDRVTVAKWQIQEPHQADTCSVQCFATRASFSVTVILLRVKCVSVGV